MFWPVLFTYYTVYIFQYNQGQSLMYSMSKHLIYSEMRRGKYFLKDPPFNSQSWLCYSFSVCWKCLRWDEEVAAVPFSQNQGQTGYRGKAEVWCPGLPGTWAALSALSLLSVSADVLRVHIIVCQVQCPGSPGGADVTRTGILPQIPGDISRMALWRFPHAPMPVANWETIQPLKFSLKKNSEVVANMKEMPAQGLFEAFQEKHFDNSYMAISNPASPTLSR